MNFPVFSQLAGKLAFRDGFARDCLLQRGVCELSVPKPPSRLLCRFSKPLDPIYESDRACNGMIFDIDNFLVVATEPLDLVPSLHRLWLWSSIRAWCRGK
jgi:hypothetical protein